MKDIKNGEKLRDLEEGTLFNKDLCDGIIALQKENFDTSFAFFNKCHNRFEKNKEAFLYRSLTYVQKYLKSPSKQR